MPIEGESAEHVIVFERIACATWCTPGSTSCRNGAVTICETSETGCPYSRTFSVCSDGQSCSLGECLTECVNECAEGETRCSGPLGVELCGQSDDDACFDWQEPILCEGALVCSNGRCADTCSSECALGSVRCRDSGISTCADSNGDGCFEWGPSTLCASGEACSGNEGMPGTPDIAQCQAHATCIDSCTANSCVSNTFSTCGNFNLDSCREPSAGTNCASANPCEEGLCDLTANGGMGGCVVRPRNTPECAGICAGQAENSSCDDNDPCTTGDACTTGLCAGIAMDCSQGRQPTCENGVARTYAMAGMCMNGTCQHSIASEQACANGCDGIGCRAPSVETKAVQVTAGDDHSCALLQDGSVRCWGHGAFGQLGNGGTSDQSTPVAVMNLSNVAAITAGSRHTCALLQDHTMRCWGLGASGQLGNGRTGTNAQENTPVAVTDLTQVIAITAGGNHTCALLQDGTMRCWGRGNFGQLGNNSNGDQSTPVGVRGLSDIASITAGENHTCALLADNTMRCWGAGLRGQLGEGQTINRSLPVVVERLRNVTAITAGRFHTCASLQDRSMQCWGQGDDGQLGTNRVGSNYQESAPAAVLGPHDIAPSTSMLQTADGGGSHSCAVIQDGTARCWGLGQHGQLGRGSVTNARSPSDVAQLSHATSIVTGLHHTCALVQNGTVYCWGLGSQGQLGNNRSGADYRETTPVRVLGIP